MNAQTKIEGEPTNVAQLPAVPTRKPTEVRVVSDPIAVLDTARFEHMQRIASVMARSNLVPESLCMVGDKDHRELLPIETVTANCFLVVNQAVRWNMDPFAVAQCVSVVHGKLCYEGKLIAAVLEAKLGIRLQYTWDNKPGEQTGIVVSGTFPDGATEALTGTVADWKTTGAGSAWGASKNWKRMLAYRGAREWCRLYAPGLMLGVLSEDEIEALTTDRRARYARDVTQQAPQQDDGPPPPSAAKVIENKPQEAVTLDQPRERDREPVEAGRDNGQQQAGHPADDGLTIPPELRRTRAPATAPDQEAFDEKGWLNDVSGAFSGCETLHDFSEKQREVMAPMKARASQEGWTMAQRMAEDTYHRVKDA